MFRLLVTLLLLFTLNIPAIAEEEQKNINFLYINGANNNTPNMEKWFFNGVNKVHPKMKKAFENSPFIREKLLKNGKYAINTQPMTFFWGDKTLDDLETVTEELNVTSLFSPFLAQIVRSFFAHCMHDAIWVQKDHNMQLIVREMHEDIKKIHDKGEQVILFGYSAGSFVTYGYLFYKLPAISWEDLSDKLNLSPKEEQFINTAKTMPTCIDALISSELAIYSTSGKLLANPNFEDFKTAYNNLDKYTNNVCIPDKTVIGTVNYASPLVLFYSDLRDPMLEINSFNKDFFIYMKNNDMFWLTVNFADDPLGYPLMKNLKDEEIEKLHNINFQKDGRGFYYDKSNVKSPATFLGAHTSYWNAAKKFSKAVTDAYQEGYTNFYPEDN